MIKIEEHVDTLTDRRAVGRNDNQITSRSCAEEKNK